MKKVSLTQGEVNHLLFLLLSNQEEGSYYSPEDQYRKRHQRILDKMNAAR